MRSRVLVSLATFTFLLLLARHHLRDLIEVARTYASYHTYIESHPETLYQYSPLDTKEQRRGNETLNSGHTTPKIIHQIFLAEGRPSSLSKYRAGLESCNKLHPDWENKLWTDENATTFMREHYPTIAPHYEGYAQSIQRANILRYALLDHFGGVYLDLDITCLTPLDNLLHLPWLTPGAYPAGVNNAFILSRPHHGFLQDILSKVPSRDLKWPMPYVENMLSTGCMYFSNRFMAYARHIVSLGESATPESRMYVLADEEGNLEPHMLRGAVRTPLFAHAGASSWHGWDAAMIVLIGKHYGWFALFFGWCAGMLVGTIWIFTRGRISGRRHPSWVDMIRERSRERAATKLDDEERQLAGKEG